MKARKRRKTGTPTVPKRRNPLARALADKRFAGKAEKNPNAYRRRPKHRATDVEPEERD